MSVLFKAIILIILAIGTLSGHAQKKNFKSDSLVYSLETLIPELIDSAGIPGISVAVIHSGKIIWAEGFGESNKERKTAVTNLTVFPAASLGKPVFAYAVLKLAEMGYLNLDSSIESYLPITYIEKHYLKGKVADKNFRSITTRMILSHSSGLPNWRSPEDSIKTLFTPGTKYSYSGEGYFLLQVLVEYLTKKPLEEWMQATVFKPLNMTNSTFITKNRANSTVVYGKDGNVVQEKTEEEANAAYTLSTTAYDYARFVSAIFKGTGLKRSTAKEMLRPQISTDICSPEKIMWGLGFAINPKKDDTVFFQWGKSPSASGYVLGLKNSRNAIVYLTNVANRGLEIGEKMVSAGVNYDDTLFSCFGVKQYNK